MSEIGFKKKIFEYFVWTRSKASVVGKTTEPHRDVVEPPPAAGLGGQSPVDVSSHVVSDQEEEGLIASLCIVYGCSQSVEGPPSPPAH